MKAKKDLFALLIYRFFSFDWCFEQQNFKLKIQMRVKTNKGFRPQLKSCSTKVITELK